MDTSSLLTDNDPLSRQELLAQLMQLAKQQNCYGQPTGLTETHQVLSLETILCLQIMWGRKEEAEWSLKLGADPNHQVNGRSLAELAQAYHQAEIFSLLLDYGALNQPKARPKQ